MTELWEIAALRRHRSLPRRKAVRRPNRRPVSGEKPVMGHFPIDILVYSPPATRINSPLIHRESSDARNTAGRATSSGSPMRSACGQR